MRVVLAPDSFKGTVSSGEAVAALRRGWLIKRPDDEVVAVPMADGGEGTVAVVATAHPAATLHHSRVSGPLGLPVDAAWLRLPDGTAVVEAASACGLTLMDTLDPLRATTFGLGELLHEAAGHPGVERVRVALGGSGTTDGGTGALCALGARLLDSQGAPLEPGGVGLGRLATVDLSALYPPPPGGVSCLVDVSAPLVGPAGAAVQFGPQKGATPDDVRLLDHGLRRLATVLGGIPDQPGAGAAGGTAYGLATAWRATLVPGAMMIARIAGLPEALRNADVVVTGEGRYDSQSHQGKVVGHVIEAAQRARVPVHLVAGGFGAPPPRTVHAAVDLSVLAGDVDRAKAQPGHWLVRAGRVLASLVGTPSDCP